MAEAAFVRGLRGAAPQTLAADSLGTLVPGFSAAWRPRSVPTDFARSVLGLAAQTLRRDERLSRADRASSPPEQTRAVEAIVSSAREIADRGSWSCEIDATQLLLCVALDEQAAGGADDAACRAVALRAAMVTAGPAPGLSDAIARRPDWQSRLASGELAQARARARECRGIERRRRGEQRHTPQLAQRTYSSEIGACRGVNHARVIREPSGQPAHAVASL